MSTVYVTGDSLCHFGVLGMKWGVRRYQNKDGTLTDEGKKRYKTAENYQKYRVERKEKIKKVAKKAAVGIGIRMAANAATIALGSAVLGPVLSLLGNVAMSNYTKGIWTNRGFDGSGGIVRGDMLGSLVKAGTDILNGTYGNVLDIVLP